MNDAPTKELVRQVLLERSRDSVDKGARALRAASHQLWRLFVERQPSDRATLSACTAGSLVFAAADYIVDELYVRLCLAAHFGAARCHDDVEQRLRGAGSAAAVCAAVRDAWRVYQRAVNAANAVLSPLSHAFKRAREHGARLERNGRGEYEVVHAGEHYLWMKSGIDVGAVRPVRELLRRLFYVAVLRPLGACLTASLAACLDADGEWTELRLCRLLAPAADESDDDECAALDAIVDAYNERRRVAEIACALAPLGVPVLLLLRVHEWEHATEVDARAGDRARRWRAAALVHRACLVHLRECDPSKDRWL